MERALAPPGTREIWYRLYQSLPCKHHGLAGHRVGIYLSFRFWRGSLKEVWLCASSQVVAIPIKNSVKQPAAKSAKSHQQSLGLWGSPKDMEDLSGDMEDFSGESPMHRFCREKWTQLSHTLGCLFIYMFVAVLNIFVLMLEIHGSQHPWLVIMLESMINAILFTEVLIAMFIQGSRYWKVWMNVFDFCVTFLCFIFFIFFLLEEAEQDVSTEVSWTETLLLAFRYFFQLVRLGLIIRGIWPKTEFLTQPDVRFDYDENFEDDDMLGDGSEDCTSPAQDGAYLLAASTCVWSYASHEELGPSTRHFCVLARKAAEVPERPQPERPWNDTLQTLE
eukprot:g76524.t1